MFYTLYSNIYGNIVVRKTPLYLDQKIHTKFTEPCTIARSFQRSPQYYTITIFTELNGDGKHRGIHPRNTEGERCLIIRMFLYGATPTGGAILQSSSYSSTIFSSAGSTDVNSPSCENKPLASTTFLCGMWLILSRSSSVSSQSNISRFCFSLSLL